jgi:hypothetical protein
MTTVVGAKAELIQIGYGPAGSITNVAGPGAPQVSGSGPDFTATAFDYSSGADLGSIVGTISVLASGTLTIWVTETGINLGPTPQKLSFLSGLTQNELPSGATVTETTWFDASDHAYGTGTELATKTFTSIDSNTPGVTTVVDAPTPYSITEEYDVMIPIGAPPTALSTISLTTTTDGPIPVTPEPSTWMMMAIGFLGLGYAAYARGRRSQVRASIV